MEHSEYIRDTDGESAVLFIHGFLGSPLHFEKFIPLIPNDFAVRNLLLNGHGGTVRDFSHASMEQWKKQANDALSELSEKHKNIYVVSHSMGTLFSIDAAARSPEKIKGLLLLAPPLNIFVRPTAVLNSVKALFGLVDDADDVGKAYQNSHSIKLNLKIWNYIGWIPRYLELFSEAARTRPLISEVDVPCFVFPSKNDELVSLRSLKHFPEKENFNIHVLERSSHFIYGKDDLALVLETFCRMIEGEKNKECIS